jgi:hypothetical protein
VAKVKSKSTAKAPGTTTKPDPSARAAILSVGAVALEIRHLQDLIQQVGIAVSLCGGDDRRIELGHASVATTEIYARIPAGDRQKKIARLLEGEA